MKHSVTKALHKIAEGYVDRLNGAGDPTLRVARSLVGELEGFRSTPYKDVAGYSTIGYGSRRPSLLSRYSKRPMTELEGQVYLNNDLNRRREQIRKTYAKFDELNPNQQAALMSFHYNVGHNAFANSTLLKRLNAGELAQVPGEFARWKYAGGRVSKGLINRRNMEIKEWKRPYVEEPTLPTPEPKLSTK